MACAGLRQATRDDTTESGGGPLTLRVRESNDCSGTGTVVGGDDEGGADVGIWDKTDQGRKSRGGNLTVCEDCTGYDPTDDYIHSEFTRVLYS